MNNKELIELAVNAAGNSYSPYSHFRVGAALLCDDGSVYLGCNIENSAYSATVCAERTAIFKAISDGKRGFQKIAVVGGEDGLLEKQCAPCGVCLQVMSEHCDANRFVVLLADNEGIHEYTLGEMLPYAFKK